MENYSTPEIEVVNIALADIITTSPGTETTPRDEDEGNWSAL